MYDKYLQKKDQTWGKISSLLNSEYDPIDRSVAKKEQYVRSHDPYVLLQGLGGGNGKDDDDDIVKLYRDAYKNIRDGYRAVRQGKIKEGSLQMLWGGLEIQLATTIWFNKVYKVS